MNSSVSITLETIWAAVKCDWFSRSNVKWPRLLKRWTWISCGTKILTQAHLWTVSLPQPPV